MGAKFTSIALDQLIKDATSDVDDLTNDIMNYDQNEVAPAVNPEISNLVQKETGGESVDFERVYKQLERLINNGNLALDTLNSLDIDVLSPEIISATTSLMNAIKNCTAEFTKIHLNHLKFTQKLALMEADKQNKIELIKLKNSLNKTSNDNNNDNVIDVKQIEVGCDDVMNFVRQKIAMKEIENNL